MKAIKLLDRVLTHVLCVTAALAALMLPLSLAVIIAAFGVF